MVVPVYKSSIQESEARGSLEFEASLNYNETLSQLTNKKTPKQTKKGCRYSAVQRP